MSRYAAWATVGMTWSSPVSILWLWNIPLAHSARGWRWSTGFPSTCKNLWDTWRADMHIWRASPDWAVPADAPAYPPPPAHYENVLFQMVFFRAATDAIRGLLPAPLEPSA